MLKRIILAEDDPRDLELTLEALDDYKLGNQVLALRDGAEVLDYLHRRGQFAGEPPGNPRLLLLDLKMPKLDGLEVLRQIKADRDLKTIPVIILTSSQQSRDVRACYELGANAYVVKPVKFAEFLEAVRQVGNFWTRINEPPPSAVHTPD